MKALLNQSADEQRRKLNQEAAQVSSATAVVGDQQTGEPAENARSDPATQTPAVTQDDGDEQADTVSDDAERDNVPDGVGQPAVPG